MKKTVEELLALLTQEEKIQLVTGADFLLTRGIPRLGIPAIKLSDGPHGVRAQAEGKADHLGLNAAAAATCFPSGAAIASSWDPALAAETAGAVAEEARFHQVQVLLGPAINMKRSPLCGRDFEYYSEDPYLAGKLAAAYIQAVQSEGVAVCPKHFAANSQEDRRMVTDSVLDQRTLREIYLPAFETAVKEGKPWSIMCAYNRLNGVFCSENRELLTDILRDEWGFDGAVVSDWGAVSDRAKALEAGLDLEMPGTLGYSDTLVREALAEGTLSQAALDSAVEKLLTLIERTENAVPVEEIDLEAHHKLAQRAAEDCMVLLKNEGEILPLSKGKKLAVLGALAEQPRYQGGGSSHVASWKVDQPLACLRELASEAEISYAPGYSLANGDAVDPALLAEAEGLAAQTETALVFVGLTEQYETEGADRKDMKLPAAHNALVEAVSNANPNTVVVLTSGAPVELPWLQQVKGLLITYTAGDGLGMALARLLYGEAAPSGKLAETWPLRLEHNPSYLNFRESKREIRYGEGIFIGYRWYEKRALPVAFPFGFGLSYTRFRYDDLQLSSDQLGPDESLTVTVDIQNCGARAGAEVVQLYVADLESSLPRPVKELKGFQKVRLEPGETKTLSFTLDRRAFAFYDEAAQDWAVEPGAFEISVGASSAEPRCTARVRVDGPAWRPLKAVTQETTFGELADDPRTYPLLCEILKDSPMYRPAEMPDAPDFLRNLPLWTVNHMRGSAVTPEALKGWIGEFNERVGG